ncbi:MAG TPA: Hsp20/alpha crystallin family protein [Gemmatimonadales bacterium]|nr:Hsp20/alpha crystallin family protein [Gemmatimonadales bacterium]
MPIITRKQTLDPMLDLLYNLERRMGRVFEPFTLLDTPTNGLTGAWAPVVDIVEEPELIRIVAEIPGVKPEDVRVSMENNILTISGIKEQVAEEKAERVHRYERTYGEFVRTFTLPVTVDVTKVKAVVEQGLLTLTLPKSEQAKPKFVEIEVGKGAKGLKA